MDIYFIWTCTYSRHCNLFTVGYFKTDLIHFKTHIHNPKNQRDQAVQFTHNVPRQPPPHRGATAPVPIFHSYLCNKSKPNCSKQMENRLSPTLPPPQNRKLKKKRSCFCQASPENTAFHFIKTITQKPAKNYIKLPPCTTPSPFSSTLLPNTQSASQPHGRDTPERFCSGEHGTKHLPWGCLFHPS